MAYRERMASLSAACVLAAATAFVSAGQADTATITAKDEQPLLLAAPPTPAQPATWVEQAKHPVDWFKWGADLRIRQEYQQNPFLNASDPPGHVWNDFRIRTRVWDTITPIKNVEINTRLTWEARYWEMPNSKMTDNHDTADGQQWMWNDGNFDTMNVRIKCEEAPVVFTIGRQDIILGDGWLVFDGTPLDGSETIYFDAFRMSLDLKEMQSAVDVIYIQQYSDPDAWLPPINSASRSRMEQDEQGVILWGTNKSIARTEINPYFIYKHDDATTNDTKLIKGGQFPGDNGDTYTLGARVKHDFDKNWSARAEAAYQFGQRTNAFLALGSPTDGSVSAYGANTELKYSFNDQWKNALKFQYEMESGDDPGTAQNEQFDVLWGRWPRWSELYAYGAAADARVGEQSNLIRLNVGWECQPAKDLTLEFNYHALFADQNSWRGVPGFSNSGDFRGNLLTGVLRYKFNQYMSGHLWGEIFFPGDYYEAGEGKLTSREDYVSFLRWEVVFTF